ncbi:hypothetical protein AVEN_1562-1 [Araneus ventricosus]|uniref:Uncharacterized protein n=1 Tax=Araneus ventricosus TaxID=182803 RepID=A0A4Y2DQ17_ARAVE|nr:hypothetical protein AVEN_1562-1 [Araneus ventricosus]
MKTTPELRMTLRSCHKILQEITTLIVFHKLTICLKKANNITQISLGGSTKPTSHVYVPTNRLKLASWRRQQLKLWSLRLELPESRLLSYRQEKNPEQSCLT